MLPEMWLPRLQEELCVNDCSIRKNSNYVSDWFGHALTVIKGWKSERSDIVGRLPYRSSKQLACEGDIANSMKVWRSANSTPCRSTSNSVFVFDHHATAQHFAIGARESSIWRQRRIIGILAHQICKSNLCNERDLKKSKSDAGVWFADSRRRTTFSPTAQVRTLYCIVVARWHAANLYQYLQHELVSRCYSSSRQARALDIIMCMDP
jgi:hypothetical protein